MNNLILNSSHHLHCGTDTIKVIDVECYVNGNYVITRIERTWNEHEQVILKIASRRISLEPVIEMQYT